MTRAPVQAAGFPNARTGVAQRAEQKLVFAVGHVVEQGAHFWRKQINGVTPFDVAIRLIAACAVEKSTSGAILSTPVRSGEFCRVTGFIIIKFSRSATCVFRSLFSRKQAAGASAINCKHSI